uniref:Uncharacterized protein n=1 Tax=Anguilla anguilla TaxID=7936 RepID=A0A0E9V2Z8_ANGAN
MRRRNAPEDSFLLGDSLHLNVSGGGAYLDQRLFGLGPRLRYPISCSCLSLRSQQNHNKS